MLVVITKLTLVERYTDSKEFVEIKLFYHNYLELINDVLLCTVDVLKSVNGRFSCYRRRRGSGNGSS